MMKRGPVTPPAGLPAVLAALREQRGGSPQATGAFGMLSTILQGLGGNPPGPASFVRKIDTGGLNVPGTNTR